MATNYVPGDPILFGLQADQVSWSEHQPYWVYGRGLILLHPGRIQGQKSPGEIGLKILLFWLKGYSKGYSQEKTPSNETLAFSKSVNMNNWVVGTSNQFFIRDLEDETKFSKN